MNIYSHPLSQRCPLQHHSRSNKEHHTSNHHRPSKDLQPPISPVLFIENRPRNWTSGQRRDAHAGIQYSLSYARFAHIRRDLTEQRRNHADKRSGRESIQQAEDHIDGCRTRCQQRSRNPEDEDRQRRKRTHGDHHVEPAEFISKVTRQNPTRKTISSAYISIHATGNWRLTLQHLESSTDTPLDSDGPHPPAPQVSHS